MKGLLLAAGIGKRLRPLTNHTPKPLLPLAGRPILEWMINGLKQAGVDDIAIITGHLAEQIEEYFGDGSKWEISLSYFRQEVQNGTAGAVLPAADFLEGNVFFMSYGDIMVDPVNYRSMVSVFAKYPGSSVLSGWKVADPSFGGALIIEDGLLKGIVEKPEAGKAPSNLINAGLMIFQPEILDHIRAVKPSPRGELELTDAMTSLAKVSPIRVHKLETFWSDIGTHEKLHEADEWGRRNLASGG